MTTSLKYWLLLYLIEILHQTTTNHVNLFWMQTLYLIEILHQTTTGDVREMVLESCILLKFYIKPQQKGVSSTVFLCCILLKFYIKPQLQASAYSNLICCILLKFYIKPQRRVRYLLDSSLLCHSFQPENRMRKLRRSEFDEFFVFQRTKILFFQKNSNCCGISGFARSLLPQKLRMSPYCLSVTDRILVNPAGGIDRLTRLM